MLRFVVAALAAVVLSSCAQQPKPQLSIRLDGQPMVGNPAYEQKFQVDSTVCTGETQKAAMSGAQFCQGIVNCAVAQNVRNTQASDVAKGCMAERGYALIAADELEAKRAQFLAATEAAKKLETPPAPVSKKR